MKSSYKRLYCNCCKNKISSDAETCPQCGNKDPFKFKALKNLFIFSKSYYYIIILISALITSEFHNDGMIGAVLHFEFYIICLLIIEAIKWIKNYTFEEGIKEYKQEQINYCIEYSEEFSEQDWNEEIEEIRNSCKKENPGWTFFIKLGLFLICWICIAEYINKPKADTTPTKSESKFNSILNNDISESGNKEESNAVTERISVTSDNAISNQYNKSYDETNKTMSQHTTRWREKILNGGYRQWSNQSLNYRQYSNGNVYATLVIEQTLLGSIIYTVLPIANNSDLICTIKIDSNIGYSTFLAMNRQCEDGYWRIIFDDTEAVNDFFKKASTVDIWLPVENDMIAAFRFDIRWQ